MTVAVDHPESRNRPQAPSKAALRAPPPSLGNGWLESLARLLPGLVAIHLVAPPGKTLLEFSLAVLLVAGVGALAVTRPRWTRRAWFRRGPPGRPLQIADRDTLMRAGDVLLQQATADRRPLCVAVLELHDLPEVRRLFGRKLTQQVLARTARSLRAVAGPKGLAARTSGTQFTLIVPGLNEDAVLLSLRTVFGEACCIEDEGGRDELVLLPHFRVTTVADGSRSVEPACVKLCEELLSSLHRVHEPRHVASMAAEAQPSQPVSLGPPQCELGPAPTQAEYVRTLPLPLR